MSGRSCEIRIGTSGWHYDHWVGPFYPKALPKEQWLEYYARRFDTVEINSTFYHLPRAQTMVHWHDGVPASFVYAVKASRYITHVKKLSDPEESVGRFCELAELLKHRLGPILYQLPPSLHKDLARLDAFLDALPKRDRAVVEFRHRSWYEQDTFDILNQHGVALCVHDMPEAAPPRVVTGRMVYVRFHGTSGRYAGSYPDSMLQEWADWMKAQAQNVAAIYAYFNNDISGYAIRNAGTLRQIMTPD